MHCPGFVLIHPLPVSVKHSCRDRSAVLECSKVTTIWSDHPCVQAILTVSANIASVDLQVEAAQVVLRCCSVLPRQEQNKHDIGGAITSSIWLAAARLSLGVVSSFEAAVSLQLQESNEMVRNDDRLTVLAVALETLLVDNTLLDACTSCADLLLAVASGAAAASSGALASAAFALQVRIGLFCAARWCCHALHFRTHIP